ncbi:recombinase family protein [Phycisphaeraceae bacterium D3-23]
MIHGKNYSGRSAVLLARASTKKQSLSVEDQINTMERFARREGIEVIATIGQAGVSASNSKYRPDLDEVVNRKLASDDFDLLLVYNMSRFTRARGLEGLAQIQDFHRLGIEVLSCTEKFLPGNNGMIQKSQKTAQNNDFVKDASLVICRGRMKAMRERRALPTTHTPFGTDRFIRNADGTPLHIVRENRDGSQTVFDANDPLRVVREYPASISGKRARYIKSKHDMVELCPGDPEIVEIVLRILRQRHIDGWGAAMIAKKLNEDAIPSCRNKVWNSCIIQKFFRQPAYIGYLVANQMSDALFYRASKDDPIEIEEDISGESEGEMIYRSPEDWFHIDQPMLANYLPDDIRPLAQKEVEYKMRLRAENSNKRREDMKGRPKNRHKQTKYLLTGLLREASTGLPMVGQGGRSKYRYYKIGKAVSSPGIQLPKPNTISVKPVEAATIAALRLALRSARDYKAMIMAEAERQRQAASLSDHKAEKYRQSLADLEADCNLIHRQINIYGEEFGMKLIKDNRDKAEMFKRKLEKAERLNEHWGQDVAERVDEVAQKLVKVSGWITDGPSATNRHLLEIFIADATANTRTKELKLSFRIPRAVFADPAGVSLECGSLYYSTYETNSPDGIPLPSYVFVWDAEAKQYEPPVVLLPAPPPAPLPGETPETAFEVNVDEVGGRAAEASEEKSTLEDRHSDSVVGDLD